jgi:nitroreductase
VVSEQTGNAADLFEIIRTTPSMRRLKPDPVPNELIRKILEAGVCASSGGNMQRWRFLVVRDAGIKQTVGALYKRKRSVKTPVRQRRVSARRASNARAGGRRFAWPGDRQCGRARRRHIAAG